MPTHANVAAQHGDPPHARLHGPDYGEKLVLWAARPLVEADGEPPHAALSLCPAAGDGWDSFRPRSPFIGAPLRLQAVAAELYCFLPHPKVQARRHRIRPQPETG